MSPTFRQVIADTTPETAPPPSATQPPAAQPPAAAGNTPPATSTTASGAPSTTSGRTLAATGLGTALPLTGLVALGAAALLRRRGRTT